MTRARARTTRWLGWMAISASVAVVAGGCTWGRRPVQRTTTTAPTTTTTTTTTTVAPSTTTTTTGHGHPEPGDDKGWSQLQLGHEHEQGEVPVDAATAAEVARQVALTQQLVAKYPTVAAATADGYRRGSPFAPGLGTHFVKFDSVSAMFGSGAGPLTDDQILHPLLMFNGNGPEAPLVGFMYMAMAVGGTTEPAGFAGPNDHWHYHTNLCVAFAGGEIQLPFGADQQITQEMCEAQGGRLLPVTGHMLHVWSVPGWENPMGGVFGDLNPKITCRDGTYYTIPLDKIGTNSTVCRDEAVIS